MTVTHGLTYSAADCGHHVADEVSGECHHRLNSARSHTDIGKDGPQNGVDPASAIENKPWSKDQRQTARIPKAWQLPELAEDVLGSRSPCVAKSFPAVWW